MIILIVQYSDGMSSFNNVKLCWDSGEINKRLSKK